MLKGESTPEVVGRTARLSAGGVQMLVWFAEQSGSTSSRHNGQAQAPGAWVTNPIFRLHDTVDGVDASSDAFQLES